MGKTVGEFEIKIRSVQDELDLKIYSVNELTKEVTAQRLRNDCAETLAEGLKTHNRQLEIQLNETKEFKELFEIDNSKIRYEFS